MVWKDLIFQMSELFNQSYLDWLKTVGGEGWSVVTIATHENLPNPVVFGPTEKLRGALEEAAEGRGVEGRGVKLVLLFFVSCFVKS